LRGSFGAARAARAARAGCDVNASAVSAVATTAGADARSRLRPMTARRSMMVMISRDGVTPLRGAFDAR
jgi:hypothetical protein